MNWDAIGAIGEVAGAIGVIVSLLYLAFQIRHSTKTAEDAAFRDIFVGVNEQFNAMTEDASAEVVLRGLVSYRDLTGVDKYKFDHYMTSFVTLIESSVISNEASLVFDETMENWGYFLRTRYLAYPGMAEWWEDGRDIFIVALQDWFDKQLAMADKNSDYWGIRE